MSMDTLQWARYDATGRWNVALIDGVTYRRSLCGRVLTITSHPEGPDRFHEVTEIVASPELHDRIRSWADAALHAPVTVVGTSDAGADTAQLALTRAATFDAERLETDARGFSSTYDGYPIVPPDRAQDLLLQSTVGCAHNACTFCTFYHDTRFRVRPPRTFAHHIDSVRGYMGDALRWRRGIFLGDANPLTANPATFIRHLEMVRDAFADLLTTPAEHAPGHPWHAPSHAVRTFCDAFNTVTRSVDELSAMARLGLHRVYLGVETGSDELLVFLRKPATSRSVLDVVERLHTAGIHVSVLLMTGVGGCTFARRHFEETVDLVRRMNLRDGDAVVFSEFFSTPGSAYAERAQEEGVVPLTRSQCRRQMRAIMGELGLPQPNGVRVQMYDARQILY